MARTQTYSMEKILAVREILRKLPVKEKEKSKAELVEFLKTDLRKAVKQGHSLKEIQAILMEQGVSVPLSRMEAVLGQTDRPAPQKPQEKPQVVVEKPMEIPVEAKRQRVPTPGSFTVRPDIPLDEL